MKIRTKTTDKLESLLIQHPHLRDDDNKLIATIWKWQIAEVMNLPYKTMKADELLKMVATHKLASTESIRRSRCKLQELKPALRGLKYEDRQKAVVKVKKELKDWVTEDVTQLTINQNKCSCTNPYLYDGICAECGLKIK